MLTFGITTSTKLASLSLNKGDKVLGEIKIEVSKTHSTTIIDQIDQLFKWCNKKIDDVENVLVSIGPGSFTGVRIAISVIKGMFYGKNINFYGINELDALAYQGLIVENNSIEKDDTIYSIIDSNKEKIYYGKYQVVSNEKLKLISEQRVGKLDELIDELIEKENEKIYLIGDAVLNYKSKLIEKVGQKVKFINENDLKINTTTFYKMLKFDVLEKVDLFNLKPNYLEKSQAEREKENGI